MDEVDCKSVNRQYINMSPITTQISIKSDSYGSGKIYINEARNPSSKLSINSSPYLGKVYINQDYSSVDKVSLNFENESTSSDKLSVKSENISTYTTDSAVDTSSNHIKVIHKVYDDERDDLLSSKSDILSDVLSGNSDSTRNIDSRSVSPSTRNESRNSEASRSLSPIPRNESRNSEISRSLSPITRNESRNSEGVTSNDDDPNHVVIKCSSPSPGDDAEKPKQTMDDFRRELRNRPGDMSSLPRDLLPKRNPFVRGSDPRVATCRGKLQNRRCQLNQEINKELRLRAGAENLFKATHNRKLRETVALELSFVNSNLQLLKEQLAALNSSVELYQNDSKDSVMPMIPLGLKETKEVDFREPFTDFILEHYSEEATQYQDAISDFMDMRQAVRTPVRHSSGVALLFRYYNQLYFIERRFFPPDRSLGIYFEWFDSLTGVPSCQRTVAFEKACILFNMAAIYTQIGAKQDRCESKGLDSAVDSLLRAAGMFRYIHENFTNAPSMDLSPDMLDMLVSLMLAQARECLFEKLVLGAQEECAARDRELCDDLPLCLDLCQESQTLAHQYQLLRQKMQADTVMSYVPYSWVSLVNIKTEFYKALSHHHIATGLLNATTTRSSASSKTQERLTNVHGSEPSLPDWCDFSTKDRNVDGSPIKNGALINGSLASREEQKIALGKAHLSEALNFYEEALRLQRMCRELKSKASLSRVLRMNHEKAVNQSALLPDGPDFAELIDPPTITPSTKFQLSLTQPDFAQHRVEDLFKTLGPVAIFSAKRHWSAPRLVQLQKSQINSRMVRNDKLREVKRSERGRGTNKIYQDEETYRNGGKVLRNISLYEKRDRSEDNSAYYYQRDIIKSDEKYKLQRDDSKYDRSNSKTPLSRQNGGYTNGYTNNNNIEKLNGNLSKHENDIVAKYNEKNMSTNDLKYAKTDGNNRIRIRNDSFQNGKDVNSKIAYFQKNGSENFSYGIKSNGDLKSNTDNLIRRISSECNLNSSDEVDGENGHEKTGDGFGFSVRGDAPVIIASVESRSLADLGGMREGDFIVAIGDIDVKWASHNEVVRHIKAAGDSLSLKLVTPMDRNYLKATSLDFPDGKISQTNGSPLHKNGSNQGSVSAASTTSSNGSTGASERTHSGAKRAPSWNPFKRHNTSRDSSSNRGSHSSNVIFR